MEILHKFGHLILRKIFKLVDARCQIFKQKLTEFNFGGGSAPDPVGQLTALPRHSSWIYGRGPTSKEGVKKWKSRMKRVMGRQGGGEGKGRKRERVGGKQGDPIRVVLQSS